MQKTHINIHHTADFASSENEKQFVSVNASHKKRFGEGVKSKLGYYGGYHYLIERDGTVMQYRGEEEVGAHNNVDLMNFKAIGVCFAGNMSTQRISEKQILAGYDLIQRLQLKYGIHDDNVQGHKKYKSTQCPGNSLGANPWGTIKKLYSEHMTQANTDKIWFDKEIRPQVEPALEDLDGLLAHLNGKGLNGFVIVAAMHKIAKNEATKRG